MTERPFAFDATRQAAILGEGDFSSLASRYYLKTDTAANRQASAADRKEARDAIIRRLLLLDDEYFSRYCNGLYTGRALADTTAETVNTGITAAATFITPGTATRALTAIASGLSGLKLSVDKNLFLQQTAPALVAKMEAQRSVVDAHIQQFLHEDVVAYPLEEGLRDFVKYYEAGTLLSAASSLSADATAQHEQATQQLQTTKLRRSKVDSIMLPSRGLTIRKVQPPLPSGEGPDAQSLLGSPPGHSAVNGNSTEQPLAEPLQARKDGLQAAFKGMTEAKAKALLPAGTFPSPGGAKELLVKLILADMSLPIIGHTNPPSSTPALDSLTQYRKSADTDADLTRLETAYRKFKIIP